MVWCGLWVIAASACGTSVCSASTCANGCCSQGRCFEGAGLRGGVQCEGAAGDASVPHCAALNFACDTQTPCCATDPKTNHPLKCNLYCEEACGRYDDPCNASLCCSTGYVCKGERCDSCILKSGDCSYDFQRTRCCPGLSCLLKPGFSTVYECQ